MVRAIVTALVLLWSAGAVADDDPFRFWYYEGEESEDYAWPETDAPQDEPVAPRKIENHTDSWESASYRGSGGF